LENVTNGRVTDSVRVEKVLVVGVALREAVSATSSLKSYIIKDQEEIIRAI